MAEQPANDLQAKAAGNKVGSMGVAVVMKAVVFKVHLFSDTAPELLDALQRLVGRVAGEQVSLRRVGPLPHLGKQRQGRSR